MIKYIIYVIILYIMRVRIEVSKGSNLKYEYDKVTGCLILDRI